MHYHHVEDENGQLVDVIPFCSDSCNRAYCEAHGLEYQGWNGCQEGSDYVSFCAHCGVVAGGQYECDHQRDNIVVSRFRVDEGEKCSHGHWIQLPAGMLFA
jgi:hypothetical protein